MPLSRLPILIGLFLSAAPLKTAAQEPVGTGEPVITERLAYPYSIDLLPVDPAPPAFRATADEPVFLSDLDRYKRFLHIPLDIFGYHWLLEMPPPSIHSPV